MPSRYTLALMLCLAGGCLDTHDASLGEQGRADAADADAALDAGGSDAGQPAPDADDAGEEDEEEEEERDASTSLLCRIEPWHCT